MIFSSVRVCNYRSIADSGELPLGPITLLIGRNNTGKSSILRAIYLLQEGADFKPRDQRIGGGDLRISFKYDNLPLQVKRPAGRAEDVPENTLVCRTAGGALEFLARDESEDLYVLSPSPAQAPNNLIYPVLSGRMRQGGSEQVHRDNVLAVWPHDGNIVSRVASLATAQFSDALQFRQLCRDVLGFEINVIPGEHGQYLGIQVDRYAGIDLNSMGTGVAGVLNLIVSLCGAHGKLFIIEEPENDLHPQALKALLDAILAASKSNQFVISTHSSIVLTRLGSSSGAVVLRTSADGELPPTTTYELVSTPERRVEVLQELGYELADLDLSEGWIIFEESSAERVVRDFLIPWFAPGLRRVRTVAASVS